MRLDLFLYEKQLARSRTEAKRLIEDGMVSIGGKTVVKAATDVAEDCEDILVHRTGRQYVSRGGQKLEAALAAFGIEVGHRHAVDIGASSGGFTDCLLQNGVGEVYAVDAGKDQMDDSLRRDRRVHVIENYNARYMIPGDFPYAPDLAVMDVSFISATCIIPALSAVLADGADYVLLVKPQFEVGREHLGKGGIVKDEKARKQALDRVIAFAESYGLCALGAICSPIRGGDGNVEYLVHFKKSGSPISGG